MDLVHVHCAVIILIHNFNMTYKYLSTPKNFHLLYINRKFNLRGQSVEQLRKCTVAGQVKAGQHHHCRTKCQEWEQINNH